MFAHGVIGCWIDSSWWTHRAISRSSQYCTTGVTKAVVCAILSVCGMVNLKEHLLLIGKSSVYSGGSRFPLYLNERMFNDTPARKSIGYWMSELYLNDPLPYNRK